MAHRKAGYREAFCFMLPTLESSTWDKPSGLTPDSVAIPPAHLRGVKKDYDAHPGGNHFSKSARSGAPPFIFWVDGQTQNPDALPVKVGHPPGRVWREADKSDETDGYGTCAHYRSL
jgi:hypothetical protein